MQGSCSTWQFQLCPVYAQLVADTHHVTYHWLLHLPSPATSNMATATFLMAKQSLSLSTAMLLLQIKGAQQEAAELLQAIASQQAGGNVSAKPAAACHTFGRLLAEHEPCSLQEEEEDIDEGDATDYEDDTSANGASGAVSIRATEDPQGGSRLRICCSCSLVTGALALGDIVAGKGWADQG